MNTTISLLPRQRTDLSLNLSDTNSVFSTIDQLANPPTNPLSRYKLKVSTVEKEWKKALAEPSIETSRATLSSKTILPVVSLYIPDVSTASQENLQKGLEHFQQDKEKLASQKITPSSVTLADGQEGPTLLVEYPSSCVIKWTDTAEAICNRLYKVFSDVLNGSSGFIVPESATFDPIQCTYKCPQGTITPLDEKINTVVQENLTKIRNNANAKEPEHQLVQFSQRIYGSNLSDFFDSHYRKLTDSQKDKFITRLGRLALLDFLMGNTDRLAIVLSSDEADVPYEFMRTEANLGNVMITWDSNKMEFPLICAIDNTIDRPLLENSDAREKYLSFIDQFLTKSTWDEEFADIIISSISNTLSEDIGPNNAMEIKNDLLTRKASLIAGIRKMKDFAPNVLLPDLQNDESLQAEILRELNIDPNTITERLKRIQQAG